jgi:transglutaminase-like putative cysteine protease
MTLTKPLRWLFPLSVSAVSLILATSSATLAAETVTDKQITKALEQAGANRPAIKKALDKAPGKQRRGMRFLVAYMPRHDLKSLTSKFLLDQTRYAYQAFRRSAWADEVPEAVFFNDVLPYASINERRDNWRADFYKRFTPVVKSAKTPGEAATLLNRAIFGQVKVRYSTARPKADQSPYESIEAGLASCTGLSVLLIDACRAVGVPARFVGTPLWADRSGNHSWIEVYHEGDWHFTGAAEPTGNQLDRAWFLGRASKALADHPQHAIFATSYKPTGHSFPMPWLPKATYVHAVNVTSRYLPKPKTTKPSGPDPKVSATAFKSLLSWLEQPRDKRPPLAKQDFSKAALTKADSAKARKLLWDEHVAVIRQDRAEEMKARVLNHGTLKMPFHYTVYGKKPKTGRSLYISLHGGGGAPKAVNDQQWNNQKTLYKPAEGVYLAPRAPTNTWNLWHQGHIDPLFDRLIENLVVFEDVDPDRVYLMGYSAGGDGVYQVAPRMADRLAAAAMMAGHPNESTPHSLRNIGFTIHMGGRDSAYNRNKVAASWGKQLEALQKADPKGYQHLVKIYPDKGHWMDRLDAAAVPWMAKFRRNARPEKIVWRQDDVTHSRFYWLAVDDQNRKGRSTLVASRTGQTIRIESSSIKRLTIRLDDTMLNLDQPVRIEAGTLKLHEAVVPRTLIALVNTLQERGDPRGVFAAEVTVEWPESSAKK